ncbi:MAG: TonB-dependent receptor [Candidatus Muirbacterium halophilum]|nr:TonB-dependent receptor [Candidatus Muirbacterium halophilum]MCK9475892.1 TonB-dependent receptor [Candidatus Muirbacterium halophilum]
MKSKKLLALFFSLALVYSAYSEKTFKLDEYVITGTKTKHLLKDAPVKTEIITMEELQKKGITNIKNAFDEIPGLKATKTVGSWGNKGNIEIQGLDSSHTMILLDGVQVLGGHGGVDISFIPISSIKRIEIVKGSASSLYGSEAIGGVINIITKDKNLNKNNFTAGFGKYNFQTSDFTTSISNNNADFNISYSNSSSDGVNKDYVASGKRESDKYREHSISGNIKIKNGNNSLDIKPFFSEHITKSGVNATTWQDRIQKRTSFNIIYNSILNDNNNLKFRFSDFEYKHYTEDKKSEWIDDYNETEITYNSVINSKNSLIFGFHKKEEERNDTGKGFKAQRDIDSLYFQAESDFGNLILVSGIRMDDYNDLGEQKNPKLTLFFNKSDNIKYRMSYGEAFKAPDMEKLYAVPWRMSPYNVISNSLLKPEESKNIEFGIDITKSKKEEFYINFFQNKVDNLISYNITRFGPPPWNMNWVNVNKSKTKGVEFTYKKKINENLSNNFTYTKLNTEDVNTGLELANKPENKITFSINKFIPENNVNMNICLYYTGKRFDDSANTIELGGYTTADLTLNKKVNDNSSFYLKLENLTGKTDIDDEYDMNGSAFSFGFREQF